MENLYVIFDKKLGACVYVYSAVSNDSAVRVFDSFVVEPGTNIGSCPEDFDLCCIGDIDMSTGVIRSSDRKFVCNAFDRQLLIQALHERRRIKLEAAVKSLPSESKDLPVPSDVESLVVDSSVVDLCKASLAANFSGSNSESRCDHDCYDRVAAVFGTSREQVE